METPNTTTIETTKHELGDMVVTQNHWATSGIRFYTVELKTSNKARKLHSKLPLLLSVTDGTLGNAKASFARQLERYVG